MEQSTTTRTEQTPRSEEKADAPSQPGWVPVFSLIFFGLLLIVTLVIDGFTDA